MGTEAETPERGNERIHRPQAHRRPGRIENAMDAGPVG